MFKRLIVLLIEFSAGLAGNLLAGYIQQDAWSNLFTPVRFIRTVVCAGAMLLILAWAESERALPWNWPWHRFWYLRELRRDPDLQRWQADFARLELSKGRSRVSSAEVVANGNRRDLVDVLRSIIANKPETGHRALILGEPGSGKTTGMERLTLDLARTKWWRFDFGKPMPVLVRLGGFQKGELLEYTSDAMRRI